MIRTLLLVCACLVVVPAGCGSGLKDKTYKVTGTIKFADGQPVTSGAVYFESAKYNAHGQIQADGAFTLTTARTGDGAPAGTYSVYFSGDLLGAGGSGSPVIAIKYGSATTSGLSLEVKPEANVFEIKVDRYTAPPPKPR